MKESLVVSFSGGLTSGFMCSYLQANWSHKYDLHFLFANTGREHEATLKFVDACDLYFGLNVVWVEAVIDPRHGVGPRHRIVDYKSADRTGRPFRDFIAKEGIPNTSRAHCTDRLKTQVIRSWMRDRGWIKARVKTAIGMRADEPTRCVPDSPVAKRYNLVYPLAHWDPVDKQDVNDFWDEMPFTLEIPPRYGNCMTCFKKSDNKLFQIAHEHPEWFTWNIDMEQYQHVKADEGDRHTWWRGKRDTAQLLRAAGASDLEILKRLNVHDPDGGDGCGSSCNPFQDIGDDEDDEL